MRHIVVSRLAKTFHIAERRAGTWGAMAGLFHRRTREVRAVDGISFEIQRGEIVGYIGPNGAGKSTTVKILSGILVPDSGVCEVDGRVPYKDRIAHVARIGVVFGQRTQLFTDLPVIESFELLRDIYRVPKVDYLQVIEELVAMLDLGPLLDIPVRQLSLGQRMRCDLVAALLHRPSILFLDEPTIGLDAIAKLAVRDFVKRLNRERGVTVILTTHDMDDIEELAQRVMVIGQGVFFATERLKSCGGESAEIGG
jgi:ABC-2 type transport system ATP-binding protein